MLNFIKRRWLTIVLVALLGAVALVFLGRWGNARKIGGQGPAEPFRIAGNFYYVGATDASAFLITGPEGHVVLDGSYPTTARLVMASIAKLGFDIEDVKVLLNSEPHADHGGGLAALQEASGAELWASDASAASTTGSRTATRSVWARSPSPRTSPPATRAAARRGRFPCVTVTGCSTWSARVTLECWPTRSIRNKRPIARATAKNPVDPFIDRDGYRAYLDAAEIELREGRTH